MAGLYGGPIIDAHIHLWDLRMDRHPWLRPMEDAVQPLGDLAPIRRTYLVDEYRNDAANQHVVAAVHVEAGWDHDDDPLAEIRWLETLDKSSGVAVRYIGYAELTAPDADAVLDRLSEVSRCVGVRQMLSWHPTEPARRFARRPGIADEPEFRRGVAMLARHGQLLELMQWGRQWRGRCARLRDGRGTNDRKAKARRDPCRRRRRFQSSDRHRRGCSRGFGHCAIDPTIAVHNGHVFKRTGGGASTAGCEGGESVGQWLLAASI